jgi:hypothetical protein
LKDVSVALNKRKAYKDLIERGGGDVRSYTKSHDNTIKRSYFNVLSPGNKYLKNDFHMPVIAKSNSQDRSIDHNNKDDSYFN